MQRFKTILGYAWAALALPLVLATFMGMNGWAKLLVDVTGVTINPNFSGGEVAATVDHGTYRLKQHRAVFDGLISEREEGFVQLDWVPAAKDGRLPDVIEETVDYNRDGKADFAIRLDTRANRARVTPFSDKVLGMGRSGLDGAGEKTFDAGEVYVLDAGRAVRIQLRR